MNIALIFAGGTGQRMNTRTKPKQFLELHGKPVIIYTLEIFDNHPDIDGIVVVCLTGWIDYLDTLIKKFSIKKILAIVAGGDTGQASIYFGLQKMHELVGKDSVVLVHDGVRPLIDLETISNNILSVKKHGNAITVSKAVETITADCQADGKLGIIMDRSRCYMAKAPQSFIYGELFDAHKQSIKDNLNPFIDSATLMQHYGYDLFMVEGNACNIKITTPTDFYIFRAIIDAMENEQIIGV